MAGAVLTAAHVVEDAEFVQVRFEPDLPGEWVTVAVGWWVVDPRSDLAVVSIPPGEVPVSPALFGRISDRPASLDVQAVGFPRWKMRNYDRTIPIPGDGKECFRDAEHVVGSVAALSNWREGTLAVTVAHPPDPAAGVSPWEGMSGAALWVGDRIVGVVARHHPRDGLARLTAARLDLALDKLEPARRSELRERLPQLEYSKLLPDVVPVPPGSVGPLGQASTVYALFDAIDNASRDAMSMYSQGFGFSVGRLHVEGYAGTGKTILALTLAGMHAHRARPGGLKALYVCFSEALAVEIETTVRGLPGASGVEICTPEWLYESVVPDGERRLEDLRTGTRSREERVARALHGDTSTVSANGGQPSRSYLDKPGFWDDITKAYRDSGTSFAAVVVDEAQDLLEPAAFTSLAGLVAEQGLFAVLSDPAQVTRSDRPGHPFYGPYDRFDGSTHVLQYNYRNTRAIAQEVVDRTRLGVKYEYPRLAQAGTPIQLHRWSDDPSLYAALEKVATNFLSQGLDLADETAVLVEENTGVECLDRLATTGAPCDIPVFYVDEFKGRERKAIVYVRGPLGGRRAINASGEQLYVGLSRAVCHAVLLEHTPARRR